MMDSEKHQEENCSVVSAVDNVPASSSSRASSVSDDEGQLASQSSGDSATSPKSAEFVSASSDLGGSSSISSTSLSSKELPKTKTKKKRQKAQDVDGNCGPAKKKAKLKRRSRLGLSKAGQESEEKSSGEQLLTPACSTSEEKERSVWSKLGALKCGKCGFTTTEEALFNYHTCSKKKKQKLPAKHVKSPVRSSGALSFTSVSSALNKARVSSAVTNSFSSPATCRPGPEMSHLETALPTSYSQSTAQPNFLNIEDTGNSHGSIRYDERTGRFSCMQCSYSAAEGNGLIEHLIYQISVNPYICPHCKERFPTRAMVQAHFTLIHVGKKMECELRNVKQVKKILREAKEAARLGTSHTFVLHSEFQTCIKHSAFANDSSSVHQGSTSMSYAPRPYVLVDTACIASADRRTNEYRKNARDDGDNDQSNRSRDFADPDPYASKDLTSQVLVNKDQQTSLCALSTCSQGSESFRTEYGIPVISTDKRNNIEHGTNYEDPVAPAMKTLNRTEGDNQEISSPGQPKGTSKIGVSITASGFGTSQSGDISSLVNTPLVSTIQDCSQKDIEKTSVCQNKALNVGVNKESWMEGQVTGIPVTVCQVFCVTNGNDTSTENSSACHSLTPVSTSEVLVPVQLPIHCQSSPTVPSGNVNSRSVMLVASSQSAQLHDLQQDCPHPSTPVASVQLSAGESHRQTSVNDLYTSDYETREAAASAHCNQDLCHEVETSVTQPSSALRGSTALDLNLDQVERESQRPRFQSIERDSMQHVSQSSDVSVSQGGPVIENTVLLPVNQTDDGMGNVAEQQTTESVGNIIQTVGAMETEPDSRRSYSPVSPPSSHIYTPVSPPSSPVPGPSVQVYSPISPPSTHSLHVAAAASSPALDLSTNTEEVPVVLSSAVRQVTSSFSQLESPVDIPVPLETGTDQSSSAVPVDAPSAPQAVRSGSSVTSWSTCFVKFHDSYACFPCCKRFRDKETFYKHVWHHLHPEGRLCKECSDVAGKPCIETREVVDSVSSTVDSNLLLKLKEDHRKKFASRLVSGSKSPAQTPERETRLTAVQSSGNDQPAEGQTTANVQDDINDRPHYCPPTEAVSPNSERNADTVQREREVTDHEDQISRPSLSSDSAAHLEENQAEEETSSGLVGERTSQNEGSSQESGTCQTDRPLGGAHPHNSCGSMLQDQSENNPESGHEYGEENDPNTTLHHPEEEAERTDMEAEDTVTGDNADRQERTGFGLQDMDHNVEKGTPDLEEVRVRPCRTGRESQDSEQSRCSTPDMEGARPQSAEMKTLDRCSFFYICSLCDFSSGTAVDFTMHLNFEHHDEKVFPCYHCNYQGEYTTDLTDHFNSHTGAYGEKKIYLCPCFWESCFFRTDSLHHVRQHLRAHASCKVFKCYRCGSSFSDEEEFLQHAEQNSLTLYTCSKCGSRFLKKAAIKDHWRTRHSGGLVFKVVKILLCLERASNGYQSPQSPAFPTVGNTSTEHSRQAVSDPIPSAGTTSTEHSSEAVPDPIPCTGNTSTEHSPEAVSDPIPCTGNISTEHSSEAVCDPIPCTGNISTEHSSEAVPDPIPSAGNTSTEHSPEAVAVSIPRTGNTSTEHTTGAGPYPIPSTGNTSTEHSSETVPDPIPSTESISTEHSAQAGPDPIPSSGNASIEHSPEAVPDSILSAGKTSTEHSPEAGPDRIPSAGNTSAEHSAQAGPDPIPTSGNESTEHSPGAVDVSISITGNVSAEHPPKVVLDPIPSTLNTSAEHSPQTVPVPIPSAGNTSTEHSPSAIPVPIPSAGNAPTEPSGAEESVSEGLISTSRSPSGSSVSSPKASEQSCVQSQKFLSRRKCQSELSSALPNDRSTQLLEAETSKGNVSHPAADVAEAPLEQAQEMIKLTDLFGSEQLHQALCHHLYSENLCCAFCDRKFDGQERIHKHLFSHFHVPLFYCCFCPYESSSRVTIKRHLTEEHPNQEGQMDCLMVHRDQLLESFRSETPLTPKKFETICREIKDGNTCSESGLATGLKAGQNSSVVKIDLCIEEETVCQANHVENDHLSTATTHLTTDSAAIDKAGKDSMNFKQSSSATISPSDKAAGSAAVETIVGQSQDPADGTEGFPSVGANISQLQNCLNRTESFSDAEATISQPQDLSNRTEGCSDADAEATVSKQQDPSERTEGFLTAQTIVSQLHDPSDGTEGFSVAETTVGQSQDPASADGTEGFPAVGSAVSQLQNSPERTESFSDADAEATVGQSQDLSDKTEKFSAAEATVVQPQDPPITAKWFCVAEAIDSQQPDGHAYCGVKSFNRSTATQRRKSGEDENTIDSGEPCSQTATTYFKKIRLLAAKPHSSAQYMRQVSQTAASVKKIHPERPKTGTYSVVKEGASFKLKCKACGKTTLSLNELSRHQKSCQQHISTQSVSHQTHFEESPAPKLLTSSSLDADFSLQQSATGSVQSKETGLEQMETLSKDCVDPVSSSGSSEHLDQSDKSGDRSSQTAHCSEKRTGGHASKTVRNTIPCSKESNPVEKGRKLGLKGKGGAINKPSSVPSGSKRTKSNSERSKSVNCERSTDVKSKKASVEISQNSVNSANSRDEEEMSEEDDIIPKWTRKRKSVQRLESSSDEEDSVDQIDTDRGLGMDEKENDETDFQGILQCKICQFAAPSSHVNELKDHLYSKHQKLTSLIKCGYCAQPYGNVSTLKNHINSIHSGKPELQEQVQYYDFFKEIENGSRRWQLEQLVNKVRSEPRCKQKRTRRDFEPIILSDSESEKENNMNSSEGTGGEIQNTNSNSGHALPYSTEKESAELRSGHGRGSDSVCLEMNSAARKAPEQNRNAISSDACADDSHLNSVRTECQEQQSLIKGVKKFPVLDSEEFKSFLTSRSLSSPASVSVPSKSSDDDEIESQTVSRSSASSEKRNSEEPLLSKTRGGLEEEQSIGDDDNKTSTQRYRCIKCNQEQADYRSIFLHLSRHLDYSLCHCASCSLEFITTSEAWLHYSEKHPGEPFPNTWVCDPDKEEELKSLIKASQVEGPSSPQTCVPEAQPESALECKQSIQCFTCQRMFNSISEFTLHCTEDHGLENISGRMHWLDVPSKTVYDLAGKVIHPGTGSQSPVFSHLCCFCSWRFTNRS